ncbi:MAG: TonB-dependent receptor, partial [Pseudomonadales bacterium]|nr:TonB-dependent receptor [Pseudomonadales bacterium]
MANRYIGLAPALLVAASTLVPQTAFAAEGDGKRRLEEVVVTAERRESTVQDTAISITAFNEEMIEDFGLRNQEDLQNYIPATTIQPYDIAIRGVGRVFRALGGDPGVSTYFNGGYSEDFGMASTEGGLYDIERIEVLRGPQGTLYGRNGIGGAVNFHTVKPSHDFSAEVRGVIGSYRTAELYGYVNGSIIEDVLAARVTAVHREREGTIKDLGGHEPLDGYGDENYALALRWTPMDNVTVDIRGNERSYGRIISSAQGAGAIVVSEAGGLRDEITGGKRNTSARVFGYRPVDTSISCTNLASRTDSTNGAAAPNCTVPGLHVFTFDGGRTAQRIVPGVDPGSESFARPNFAYGWDSGLGDASYIGDGKSLPSMDGGDLLVATNGFNDEQFDHQNGTVNVAWDVLDNLTIKYIGSYTDYLYYRITEDDRSSNTLGNSDLQFHANQENENYQHEVQVFVDFTEDLTLTAGLFVYENQIDQRLDYWSPGMTRFNSAASYGATATGLAGGDPFLAWHTARAIYGTNAGTETNPVTGELLGTNPLVPASQGQVGWASARDTGCGVFDLTGVNGTAAFSDPSVKQVCFLEGPWLGDKAGVAAGNTPSGPDSDGTSFIWNTENRTSAKAVYAQGEWQINDTWALTLGLRWAEDKKEGFENLYLYREEELTAANLYAFNVDTGALNADGTPTDSEVIRFRGLPFSQSIYRAVAKDFDEWTWRVNVDYTPDENNLIYLSATTGYRAGGFNLGYFSATPSYDPEKVLAYELGYKGEMLDGTLQVNASAFFYDYEDVHLQFVGNSFTGASTSVRNMESAENKGLEVEVLWLPLDQLTVGANYSYTDTEYTSELVDTETGQAGIVDDNDPLRPASVFSVAERATLVKGAPLQRVPESKFSAWATYVVEVESGTVDVTSSYSWTDEICFSIDCGPLNKADDWYRWDARVTWTS